MDIIATIVNYQIPSYVVIVLIGIGFIMGMSFDILRSFKMEEETHIQHVKNIQDIINRTTTRMEEVIELKLTYDYEADIKKYRNSLCEKKQQLLECQVEKQALNKMKIVTNTDSSGEEDTDEAEKSRTRSTVPLPEDEKSSRLEGFKPM